MLKKCGYKVNLNIPHGMEWNEKQLDIKRFGIRNWKDPEISFSVHLQDPLLFLCTS